MTETFQGWAAVFYPKSYISIIKLAIFILFLRPISQYEKVIDLIVHKLKS